MYASCIAVSSFFTNHFAAAEQSIQNETATKEDIHRWARSIIKLRDERMEQAEEQLRQLAQAYSKLRQELIPVFKMAKERLEPLPNVPGYHVSSSSPEFHGLEATSPPGILPPPEKSGLSRSLSLNKKKLILGLGPRITHRRTFPPPFTRERPLSMRLHLTLQRPLLPLPII